MTKLRGTTVSFSQDVYSVEAVKRAAYAFMARAAVHIDAQDNRILCTVKIADESNEEDLLVQFEREVLDQSLRIELETKTEPLRNMVLGLAFSRVAQNG